MVVGMQNVIGPQAVRFGGIGVLNTLLDLGLFWLLLGTGVDAVPAHVASYSAGIVCSFVLNRHWTFGSQGHWGGEFVRFLGVNAVSLAATTAAVAATAAVDPMFAKLLALGVSFCINFGLSRRFVFRPR